MKREEIGRASKPADWPCNDREHRLDLMVDAFERFRNDPSFATKEVLVSLACQHDLNQNFSFGRYRIDIYEGALLNNLYMMSLMYNVASVRSYIYEHVARVTRMHKIVRMMTCNIEGAKPVGENIEAFEGLFSSLELFYVSYRSYIYNKDKEYSAYLIDCAGEGLSCRDADSVRHLQRAYVNLLNDISYMRGTKYDYLFRFSRKELLGLFALEAKLLSKVGENPSVRPLMGVLCTQISNFILKSRNSYDDGPVVKYVSPEVASSAVKNNEIWIRTTDSLNDSREGRLMREIVESFDGERYGWARGINAVPSRIYNVCCFSRSINDDGMKKRYGSCMYGFRNDRMVDLLSPVGKIRKYRRPEVAAESCPEEIDSVMNAQVVAMDVLYGREKARTEYKYLCSVIDLLDISAEEKRRFLEEIIQYWLFSVKDDVNADGEWACEKEHRFVLFTYDGANYLNMRQEGNFIKIQTSLYMFPDFVLGENPTFAELARRADEKRTATSWNNYVFCHDCLMRDYDIATSQKQRAECPICGSKNVEYVPVMDRRLSRGTLRNTSSGDL